MRYRFLFGSLFFFSCLCFSFFHLIYSGAKETAISELNSRQMIHARQAGKGIEDFFENLTSFMSKISESSHIINLDDIGRGLLDFSFSSSSKDITAITRVDQFGKISYTVPYNENVIGKDISSQKHVKKILTNKSPVVSDIFTAVQGYPAIAVHVPIFNGKEFYGTLGILVNFNGISKRFLDEIKIGETGYAWMTSSKGIQLYSPVPGHTGESIFETGKKFPSLIAMAEEMAQKRRGVTTYIFDQIKDLQTKPTKKQAVFMPVTIVDSFWSLVVASNEDEVLISLIDLKNKILIVAGLLFLGSVLFSYYGMKAWGIIREREERQKAEQSLLESKDRLQAIFSASPDPIIVYNNQGHPEYLNEAFSELFHWHLDELRGRCIPFVPEDQKGITQIRIKEIYNYGDPVRFETKRFTKHGVIIDVLLSAAIIKDIQGKSSGLVVNLKDITERKKLESEIKHSQKMEAIGTLAGGIAHDFNNILAAILGYAEMARDDSPSESSVVKDLDKVLEAGNRAKSLVQQILAFSHKGDSERIPIQPASIVKESIKMLRPSLPTTIEINQNIDSDTGLILADPTQINQIIMNLGTNAFHAMEKTGGKLDISLNETTLSSEDFAHDPNIEVGSFIQLSVCDSGRGMAPETKERIFDPYFTTKEAGKGTGMGLAIIHGIVKSYGGFISLHSEPDEGTAFHVFLPVIENDALTEIEAEKQIVDGKERVLLVDDEEILAGMGKDILERFGYHVTVRTNSIEALETFQNQPDEFDVVITDQTMPGMTGVELARRMLQIRPDIPIILCTGYSSTTSEEQAKSMGIKEFAMKPLSKKDITQLIRKVLDT